MTLEVDISKHKLTYAIGEEGGTVDLDLTWMPPALFFSLGASYAKEVTRPWHVRFDDAEIITKK